MKRYARVWVRGRGHVLEHRYVVEQAIGRRLASAERVHHRNGDKLDNRLENLELCGSHKEHHQHHLKVDRGAALRLYRAGFSTRQVASKIGASPAAVRVIAREAGILRSKSEAARLRPRNADGKFWAAA